MQAIVPADGPNRPHAWSHAPAWPLLQERRSQPPSRTHPPPEWILTNDMCNVWYTFSGHGRRKDTMKEPTPAIQGRLPQDHPASQGKKEEHMRMKQQAEALEKHAPAKKEKHK